LPHFQEKKNISSGLNPNFFTAKGPHELISLKESHVIVETNNPFFNSKILFTAEHSSNRLPEPYEWNDIDKRLFNMHWALDIGVDLLTLELTRAFQSFALLACFTRLLIDANRPLDSDTLIRKMCDNNPVSLNVSVSEEDKDNRLTNYYHPYRQALIQMLEKHRCKMHIPIHSFTPLYEGNARKMEIGVLYKKEHPESIEIAKKSI